MKIIYPFYPGGKHEQFAEAVNQFGQSPYELIVIASPDCRVEMERFINTIDDKFALVTRTYGSSNSPVTNKEKDYWENLLLYTLLPILATDRHFVYLHEDDIPCEEGWATKLENVIMSSGLSVSGYCNFKDNGLVPSGTLLFNNLLNSQFRTWRFPAKTNNLRYNMRYEMLNYGDALRADILPFQDSFKWTQEDEDNFQLIVTQRDASARAAESLKNKGNARKEELYNKKFPEKKPIIKEREPIPAPGQVRSIGIMPENNPDVIDPKDLIKDPTNESINFAKLLQPKAPTVEPAVEPSAESSDTNPQDIKPTPVEADGELSKDTSKSSEDEPKEQPKKTAKKAAKKTTKKTARKRAKKQPKSDS